MYARIGRFVGLTVFLLLAAGTSGGWAATLSGRVYEGSQGDESTPLAGVDIHLYASADAGGPRTQIDSATSDATGWYGLSADGYEYYFIVAQGKTGYTFEASSSVGGSASGSEISYDTLSAPLSEQTLTGNRFWYKKEGTEPPPPGGNRPPVAVDDSASTAQDTAVDISVLTNDTDPDGDPLHVNAATDPPHGSTVNHGTHVTYTPDPGYTGTDSFDYTAGDGNGGTDTATVTVTVYRGEEPPDGRGVLDGYKRDADTGAGLTDWRIYIDLNANGQWDDGEPSDLTDGNGYYRIADVEPGMYRVCEEMQAGWQGDSPCVDGVAIIAGVTTTQDFHNRRTQPPEGAGAIRGAKFDDLDGNGRRDPGEPGLAGWRITLEDADGNPLAATTTDASGNYSFDGLEPGTYRVDEVVQSGWRQTYPMADGGAAFWLVEVAADRTVDETDFGNVRDDSPPGSDIRFDMCLQVDMEIPGMGHVTVQVSGPASLRLQVGPSGEASDSGGNGLDDAVAELTGLNLQGIDPVVGTVRISLHPTRPSAGRMEERANNVPGVLDIAPFTTTGSADSFFDVWLQIDLPDLGVTLLSGQSKRLTGVIAHVPPGAGAYAEATATTVGLLDQNEQSTGARLGPIRSCGSTPPPVRDEYDFGDAPDSYGTLHGSGGPYHDMGEVLMGSAVDAESDGKPGAGADGDDNSGDDEDGIVFLTALAPGGFASVLVEITAPLGVPAAVAGWIDFDRNGSFDDPAERVVGGIYTGAGATVPWTQTFSLPAAAVTGPTYARFRIYRTEPGVDVLPSPGGYGGEGEVEDYRIEIVPDGSVPPSGNLISGIKFDDLDGDGVWEPADGEARLPNWTIWLDENNDGTPDKTTVTDSQGGFDFAGLSPGTYTVGEQQQPGWTQTAPPTPGTFSVTIPSGAQPTAQFLMFGNTRSSGRDYGDAPLPYPAASHLVGGPYLGLFGDIPDPEAGMQRDAQAAGDDNDGNGDDENGLLSINLVKTAGAWSTWELKGYFGPSRDVKFGLWIDFNGDGDWDEPNELRATFGFCGFGPGPQDWFHAQGAFQLPADAKVGTTYARLRVYNDCNGSPSAAGDAGPGEVEDHLVEIKADGPGVPPGGIVHGYKWNDLNGSGLWDILNPIEPPLAGWVIWLDTNHNGKQDAGDMTTQTDAQGHFRFTGVPAGTYTLGEQSQAGWTQTTPGGAGTYTVTVQPGQASMPQMFGNRQSGGPTNGGRICGSKWNDVNGDGTPDATEPLLPNWKIYLDLNQNGRWDVGEPFQVTDAAGNFEFAGLATGSYTVAEEMQAGWQQTWPGGAGTHTLSIQAGVQAACVMFGNRQGQGPGPGGLFDWGDAPDPTYPTLRAGNGAYHSIVTGLHLGASVDDEADGQPAPDALGDDHSGGSDEDGVFFLTPLLPGGAATVEVIASAPGRLDGWIDFEADGSWTEASDHILLAAPVQKGSNILTFSVPVGAATDVPTYARFRFSSAGGLGPHGPAADGEVEDYQLVLGAQGPAVPAVASAPHIKWSQPPVEIDPNVEAPPIFCGWGEPARSTQHSGLRRQWRMDADDFRCLGPIPITRIRWWGSYKGWGAPEPPENQPEAWHIGFWANQVEGLHPDQSYLERLVWSVEVPPERVRLEPGGQEQFPGTFPERCFAYELALAPEEWFHQSEFASHGDIFWISITAIYPADSAPMNQWGWLTRPHVWRDGAVMPAIMGEWPTPEERLFPGRISPIERPLLCEDGKLEPCDLCFELLTEQPWVKWDGPLVPIREWPYASDRESMAFEDEDGDVTIFRQAADDWICTRPGYPVVAMAWHGSYIGYGYEACACDPTPAPRRPDYFLLSIHANEPADERDPLSHARPGETVWEYRADDFEEVLVGYDGSPLGEPNEPVFRYSVRLPPEAWFRGPDGEQVYWLSVVAVYRGFLDEVQYPWGWTDRPHDGEAIATFIDHRTAAQPRWRILRDPVDRGVDLSFTLYTTAEPGP